MRNAVKGLYDAVNQPVKGDEAMSRAYVHEFFEAGRLLTLLSELIIEGRSFTLDPIFHL
jgi:hypothetical protein